MANPLQAVSIRVVPGLACLVAAAASTGCIKPPETHLVKVEINSISKTTLGLRCTFKIVNPNRWGADVESMECTMIAGKQQLASGKAVEPMPTIPGLSVTTVPIDVSLDLVKTFSLFKEYRQGGTLPYMLVAKPVFKILGTSLPITITNEKELPSYKELKTRLIRGVIEKLRAGMKPDETPTEDSDE